MRYKEGENKNLLKKKGSISLEKPKSPFFNPISNVEDSLDVIKIFTILNAVKVLDEECQSQWSRPL